MNQAKRDLHLIQNDVRNGDTAAYNELAIVYLDYPEDSLLPYAIMMADKYDYTKAYLDVYYCILDMYAGGDVARINEIDLANRKKALKYLKVAADRGLEQAKTDLDTIEQKSMN